MTDETPAASRTIGDRYVQLGLYVVAALCVGGAVAHAAWPNNVDEDTAMFLALGAAVLALRHIKLIELPGGTKLELHDLAARLGKVDKQVELLEAHAPLPGTRQSGPRVASANVPASDALAQAMSEWNSEWNSDPNAGRFNQVAEASGRRLSGRLTPAAGPASAACEVALRVESIDARKPLSGHVTFYLHPTFGRDAVRTVPVLGNAATLTITSWGTFTVGAEADNGATRLELDLATLPGGTKRFYEE